MSLFNGISYYDVSIIMGTLTDQTSVNAGANEPENEKRAGTADANSDELRFRAPIFCLSRTRRLNKSPTIYKRFVPPQCANAWDALSLVRIFSHQYQNRHRILIATTFQSQQTQCLKDMSQSRIPRTMESAAPQIPNFAQYGLLTLSRAGLYPR